MAPLQEGAAAAATATNLALEFGWVPAEAVRSLVEEVGNFRARSIAIELLHATVLDVGAGVDPAAVRATLSAFLAFLLRLVADHNFKIAASAMAILEDLAARLGTALQPYLGSLTAPLIERLGDGVQMVRAAAARALAALARMLGPAPVLKALGGALVHPQWRVREEGVNAYNAGLLSHPKEQFDYPACVRALAVAAADETPRVAMAALEAFALLHVRLGALLQGLLTAVGASEAMKRRVADRVHATPHLGLPMLDAQGLVQHQAHARPPSAQQPRLAVQSSPAKSAPASEAPLQLVGKAALPSSGYVSAGQPDLHLSDRGALPSSSASAVRPVPAPQPQPAPSIGALEVQAVGILSQYSPTVSGDLQRESHLAASVASSPELLVAGMAGGSSSGRSSTGYSSVGYGLGAAAAIAVAAEIEYSATSYVSISSTGCEVLSTGCSSIVPAEDEREQQLERSEGSLLSWVRPARRPAQQLFTASRRACRPALGAGADAPDVVAAAAIMDGVRSFVRSSKPTSTGLQRRKPARAAASVLPAPASSAAPVGTHNAALFGSVRNWQQQRGGSSRDGDDEGGNEHSTVGTGAVPSRTDSRSPAFSWQQPEPGIQDGGLAVEARSDSLLQWRLPPRAASSRQSAAGLQQQQQQHPATASPTAPSSLQGLGSASLRRTLSSFKKRIFGAEAPAAEDPGKWKGAQAGQQEHPGSPGWSIAAVREQATVTAAAQQQEQQQHKTEQLPAEEGCGSGRPGLTVAVPGAPAMPESPDQHKQQLERPGTTAERLNRLKRMTERRRVSSAPIGALLQRQQQQAAEEQISLLDSAGAVDGPTAAAPDTGGKAAVSGSGDAEGSSGARPGLQALKARARTARIVSNNGSATSATLLGAAGIGSLYSIEAVDDVFGPDQPVPMLTSSWSPLKAAPVAGGGSSSSSPPKSALLRNSTSPSLQWPDSPSSGGTTPGRSAWRTSSYLDATSAASSPQAVTTQGAAVFSPAADTAPLAQPEAALQQVLGSLQQAALSQIKELDWQAQHEALCIARRLARYHPAVVAPAMKALVVLAAPIIDALRSTLSRLAIAIFEELAEGLGPGLDTELEVFVPLLLKRAGQVSLAGRDNFLAVEADQALAAVVAHAGEARVAATLLNCLTNTKSADIRSRAAMHLDSCLQQHGARLVNPAADRGGGGAALVPRLLRAAVGLLDEGRLEARIAGKRMLWELRRQLDGRDGTQGNGFRRALARLDCKTDKVWDVFEAASMPALPPIRACSASLRSGATASSGLPSPTAGARQSILNPSGGAVEPLTRSPSGGSTLTKGSSTEAALARVISGSGRASIAALPASKWQPTSRPGSTAAGRSGDGCAAGGGGSKAGVLGSSGTAGRRDPSRSSSDRPSSSVHGAGWDAGAAGGSLPTGSLAGVDPELQHQLEAAALQLDSGEWKERLQGLEVLQAASQLAPEAQLWVASVLTEHVADANLKVQQQALMALNRMLASAGNSLAPAAAGLVAALCKCADSGNPSVRQGAAEALDVVLGSWDAAAFMPPLMAALGSPAGGARCKLALLDRLTMLGPLLWQTRPALIRKHVLPALFALLAAERRPELRQMVQGALAVLVQPMGPELVAAAASLPPQQHQVVSQIVAARGGSAGAPQ